MESDSAETPCYGQRRVSRSMPHCAGKVVAPHFLGSWLIDHPSMGRTPLMAARYMWLVLNIPTGGPTINTLGTHC